MRIIAGEYGGRVIQAPAGSGTRPTTDRVRESLMSALSSALGGFDGVRAYDVFAGSGALGIEVLSRGGSFCLFTDADAKAVQVIRGNLETLGVPKTKYGVVKADVLKRLPAVGDGFDLVLLDPPYATDPGKVVELLARLEGEGCLASRVLVTYEHAKGTDISALTGSSDISLVAVGTKLYGDIAIDFLRRGDIHD